MGNAIRPSDDVIDVCYGLRSPASAHTYLQPIVSEFNMKTGEKLLDITINARTDQLVNVMYQINRGINIYENK